MSLRLDHHDSTVHDADKVSSRRVTLPCAPTYQIRPASQRIVHLELHAQRVSFLISSQSRLDRPSSHLFYFSFPVNLGCPAGFYRPVRNLKSQD